MTIEKYKKVKLRNCRKYPYSNKTLTFQIQSLYNFKIHHNWITLSQTNQISHLYFVPTKILTPPQTSYFPSFSSFLQDNHKPFSFQQPTSLDAQDANGRLPLVPRLAATTLSTVVLSSLHSGSNTRFTMVRGCM